MIAILQCIPEISVSGGIPNILLPLTFVLTVSAAKDALEDYKRHKSDQEENNRQVYVFEHGSKSWFLSKWQDLQVGQIVKVMKDEYFPADIVLLTSSEKSGICYIETKSLDGETNLKHKLSEKATYLMFENGVPPSFSAKMTWDAPNSMIYSYNGMLEVGDQQIFQSREQFLFRGASLKNTAWIIGVVVYSGHETKIMLNSTGSVNKFSKLETQMNRQIVYVFIMQCVLCMLGAVFHAVWFGDNDDQTEWYLALGEVEGGPSLQFVHTFFTWMLLFSNFVPISLIVTLEVVKFIQAVFISWDIEIYHEPNDQPTKVQTSNLNEELGQVSYVFSDKTGTLTQNVMEFRKLSLMGTSYGTELRMSAGEKIENVDFVDPEFDNTLEERDTVDFLLHLACCHTIIPEVDEDKIVYKASSPDEMALVYAAAHFGVTFEARDLESIKLRFKTGEKTYKILKIIEFSSDRARMTVIIQLDDKTVRVMVKGSDAMLQPRLVESEVIGATWKHIEKFATEGLRTLVLAQKDMSLSEYQEWDNRYNEAMQDRENFKSLCVPLFEEIESNLVLLGATAIEDKLQDFVPATIAKLRRAKIKVWVLTGDKKETAINIGYSCSLLTNEVERVYVDGNSSAEIRQQISEATQVVEQIAGIEVSLIVTGEALIHVMRLATEDLTAAFLNLATNCDTVIACRVSPKQKAELVELVKENNPNIRTLSIGDGANDVNMIIAAHVGIGIAGLEGKQASRAADYSIAQFSFLQRLLLVHGREAYRKNAYLICYNFYKNCLLVFPLFWYGAFSVFSGQIIYNNWTYQLYNVLFVSWPIMVYAIFDKEVEHNELMRNPVHYKTGISGAYFGTFVFWRWIFEAVWQGLAILMISVHAVCDGTSDSEEGRMHGMWFAGLLVYSLIVTVANIQILCFSYSHTWFSVAIIGISIVLYYIASLCLTELFPIQKWLENYNPRGGMYNLFVNPNAWLAFMIVIVMCFFLIPAIPIVKEGIQACIRYCNKSEVLESDSETEKDTLLPHDEPLISIRRHLRRAHTGFAFSGEAGHTPQITNPNFDSN